MSILSEQPDGMGFYYGFVDGDPRQINVRLEVGVTVRGSRWRKWVAHVGGDPVAGHYNTKDEAEDAAIAWITKKAHPVKDAP